MVNREPIVDQIPALRRYARALTGDSWAADDLVQDTLERACSKWRLWLMGSNLRAWLFCVMHNLFVNQLRQSDAGRRLARVDINELSDDLKAPESAPDQRLDLQRCLQCLPPEQREVFLLVSLEDMSYAQVAKVTGVPIGTVMSRLSRARVRLQALMDAPALAPEDAAIHRPTVAPFQGLHRLK